MPKLNFSKIHFPTAIGLFILLIAIGVGVFLVKTRTIVSPGAEESASPKQVHITNVTDSGFTVSWLTDKPTTGSIKYGVESGSFKQQGLDDRDQLSGESEKFMVHHITMKNLKSQTDYYFKLESDKKQFDNNNKPFQVKTGPSLGSPPIADPIYGSILGSSGSTVEGVVVYVNVANAAPLSALVKANGNWALSLATARTTDLSSYLNYDTQATLVNLLIQGGTLGTASAVTTTLNDSPVPDISLGQSYDFRTTAVNDSTASDASGKIADTSSQAETVTGFSLEPIASGSGTATISAEVTLENPSFDGEVLNASQPAFIGTGPSGIVLAIEINSESTYTGSAIINEDGTWEFTAPQGLEPGEHIVKITYIDSQGEEQILSRSFVVASAGETTDPAITATPSGESTDSAARTSLPATDSGVPEPGSGEITMMMLIIGLGLLTGGLLLKFRD